jgi:thiosulfate reductase cytochrome b subunit
VSGEESHLPDDEPRRDRELVHSGIVRATHWLLTVSVFCLLISGTAILIAHPRFYWGETGTFSMPAWLEIPISPIYENTGWGRHLHFLSAWVFVLSGLAYVVAGLFNRHFRADLLPSRDQWSLRAVTDVFHVHLRRRSEDPEPWRYNVVQKLVYLFVVFVLCPAMIWTGLAMSPAVASEYPFLATLLGGHQSARTIHFIVADVLVAFLVVHVTMLVLIGFGTHLLAMITGYRSSSEGQV